MNEQELRHENEMLHGFLNKWRKAERRWRAERERLVAKNEDLKSRNARLRKQLEQTGAPLVPTRPR